MSSEQPGFKVSDQRHFAADGSPRTARSEEQTPAVGCGAEAEEPAASPVAANVEFSGFILSLAAQAGAFLHATDSTSEDAAGRSASQDPEAARQIIGILEMLQDKTEGRRTAEETRLLDGLLFELRMAYVARHQRGGR